MERKPVKSSNIVSVGHDSKTQTLHVEFQGGDVHEYYGVPEKIHADFVKAPSIGGFFHKHIRGKFTSRKLCFFPGFGER